MYTSRDISDYSGKLVSIDLVRVNGNMVRAHCRRRCEACIPWVVRWVWQAYAVWKWHQIFTYKGTPNNDISTVT